MTWFHHMRRGEFERAWAISDAVLQRRRGQPCSHLPRHEQWTWDGTPLDGKRVLVRCYHGLGDTIQFIRYIPVVKAVASRVIVWMQPSLMPLFTGMAGIDELLPLHEGTPGCEYDVDVEIMELPHVFRTTVETIPRAGPYVRAPRWRPALAAPCKGVAIAVFPTSGDWDRRRDLPLDELARLARVPGVSLYALGRERWAHRRPEISVLDLPDTIPATAAALAAVDLVVSVDSMPAHLAGAMGVPVWTLLHADADWRWMEGRDDTPWYPSMRLFRQPDPGGWSAVVDAVIASLTRRSPAAREAPSRQAAPR
jgi:glycosyl transferase family 9 (putative heptosyltransferase)